jgi:hypothetical protein
LLVAIHLGWLYKTAFLGPILREPHAKLGEVARMTAKTIDRFWAADLDEIEQAFLQGQRITDLPAAAEDPRIPPQGRWRVDRTVNVDTAVERYLRKPRVASRAPWQNPVSRLFNWLVFG